MLGRWRSCWCSPVSGSLQEAAARSFASRTPSVTLFRVTSANSNVVQMDWDVFVDEWPGWFTVTCVKV